MTDVDVSGFTWMLRSIMMCMTYLNIWGWYCLTTWQDRSLKQTICLNESYCHKKWLIITVDILGHIMSNMIIGDF